MNNRTLLEKADLALSDLLADGGLLQPAQAQKFMRLLIKPSVLLPMCTVVPMTSHKQLIETIRFGSRIMRPGVEATALSAGNRVKPDTTKSELDAQLIKAEIRLNNEVLEDNIERGALRQTIMQLIGEAASRDLEELVIQGNTAHPTDTYLQVLDGLLVQATTNTVDANGARLNRDILRDLLKAMPQEFLRSKKELRFFTSHNAELDYRHSLAARATVAGDKYLQEDAPILFSGVPIVSIPMFPENLGAGTDETNVLLTHPKNIHVGIWRQIRIETDKDVSAGVLIVVVSMRVDVKYAYEPAAARAYEVLAT